MPPCSRRLNREPGATLDPCVLVDSSGTDHVTSVPDTLRLDQQQMYFLHRYRPMLDSARDYHELTRGEHDPSVTKFNGELTFQNHEQLVLLSMRMPHELSLDSGQLHMAVVQVGHDLGAPLISEAAELINQVDLRHHARVSSQ